MPSFNLMTEITSGEGQAYLGLLTALPTKDPVSGEYPYVGYADLVQPTDPKYAAQPITVFTEQDELTEVDGTGQPAVFGEGWSTTAAVVGTFFAIQIGGVYQLIDWQELPKNVLVGAGQLPKAFAFDYLARTITNTGEVNP